MNLNRAHIQHAAENLAKDHSGTLKKLWKEISGHDQLSTLVSAFNTALKAACAGAEASIAFATVVQVLQYAPLPFKMSLGGLLALAAVMGFPFVEGGALTHTLAGKFIYIDSDDNKQTLTLNAGTLKRIFYPEQAMLNAIHVHETNLTYGTKKTAPTHRTLSLASTLPVNLNTLISSIGIGLLAFLDIKGLLPDSDYRYVLAGLVGLLYAIADTALHGIPTKRALYGIPGAHTTSNLEAIKHAPLTTVFAFMQACLIALIPFMVMLELCYFDKKHIEAKDADLLRLIAASLLAAPKLLPSFLVEGMGIVHELTHKDGGPLFSWFFNLLQFAVPGAAIALYQFLRQDFGVLSLVESYSMAAGGNLLLSTIRHQALKVADPEHVREFYSGKHMLGWAAAKCLVPFVGALIQALMQYVIMPQETDNDTTQHTWSTVMGFVMAGLAITLWRLLENKKQLFYEKKIR